MQHREQQHSHAQNPDPRHSAGLSRVRAPLHTKGSGAVLVVLCGVCGKHLDVTDGRERYDAIDHALDAHREILLDNPKHVWFHLRKYAPLPTGGGRT